MVTPESSKEDWAMQIIGTCHFDPGKEILGTPSLFYKETSHL